MFEAPAPARQVLAVDIALPADHDVPLYASVQADKAGKTYPPNANADVLVPAPPKLFPPTITAPPADQVDPL